MEDSYAARDLHKRVDNGRPVIGLTDITETVHTIYALLLAGDETAARALLPPERPYPLPADVAATIAASPS